MKLLATSVIILFSGNNGNLRESIKDNENMLDGYFLNANILPVFDNADNNVPRAIFQTKNDHSILTVTGNSCIFDTKFDDKYCNDINKCYEYIEERINTIYRFADIIGLSSNLYVGIKTTVLCDKNNDANTIKKNFVNSNLYKFDDIYDFSYKFVYQIIEKYYINVSFSNYREFEKKFVNNRTLFGKELENKIIVEMDINDKLASNTNENYYSNVNEFGVIKNISLDYLLNDINNYMD